MKKLYLIIVQNKIRYILGTSVLFLLSISSLCSQERTVPVILSLWNPVATTPYDSLVRTYFNFGFQSTTQNVDGAAINLFAHLNKGNLNGFQMNTLSSVSRGNMHGVQLSTFYNATGDCMRGLQLAAIQNTAVRRAWGAQIAAMTNFIIGDGRGMQLAGLTNIAGSRFRGFQLAGGVNLASSSVKIVQIAGINNICADTLKGVQISLVNYTGTLKGVQIGVINVCSGEVKGVQVGIINRSADTSTVKIGLVNINPKTRIGAMFYGGNTTKINFAVRFTNRHIYTLLGFGSHYRDLDTRFSGAIFYRAGYEWTLVPKRFFVSGDLGYAHIENFMENEQVPRRMYSLQARVNFEYHFCRYSAVFASGGYAHTRYYTCNRVYENKPIFEMGLALLNL